MVMMPLVGRYLTILWERLKGLPGRRLLAAAFLLVCTLSGGLSLARETISRYELFNATEVQAAELASKETPRDAVFLTGQQHDNPIAALAGRQIVCGTGSYLYFHGISYAQQAADCRFMLEDPAENLALYEQYGVDYVYISSYERSDFAVDELYFAANCPLVYDSYDTQIYAWSGAAREAFADAEFSRTN